MRVDVSQMMGQSSPKTGVISGAAVAGIQVGDTVRAEVISCKSGIATLKNENGNILRAKLDPGVTLSQGDKVLLETVGKEDGIISLSIREDDDSTRQETLQPGGFDGSVKGFGDKSLAAYADKLSELNMPVTEETARMMREIMTQNPGVSIEEAAFLASNKLGGDPSLINPALALINGGEKTGEMISRLLELLENQGDSLADSGLSSRGPGDPDPARPPIPDAGISSGEPRYIDAAGNKAPLMELLDLIREGISGSPGLSGQGGLPADSTAPMIITQSDGNTQSTNVGKFVEYSTNELSAGQEGITGELTDGGQAAAQAVPGAVSPPGLAAAPDAAANQPPAPQGGEGQTGGANAAHPLPAPSVETDTANLYPGAAHQEGARGQADATGKVVAGILSQIPEFRNTPASALERFSSMLYRVAMDSDNVPKGETEKLMLSIEKLFTRIGRGENSEGERLKAAREEIFTRIAIIEEEISRAAPPARAEMLEQMGRLTDHLRLMNNINQFVYLQLPVFLGDEPKTAELYMFKKKRGNRADPENVNILLALDLEHMGRWEALLNFRKKDVSVQMEVRGEKEKQHFSENTVQLHEMLSEAGFKLVNTDIKFSKKETTPVTALSTFDRFVGSKSGTIDFMI